MRNAGIDIEDIEDDEEFKSTKREDFESKEKSKQSLLENKFTAKKWLLYLTGGRVRNIEDGSRIDKRRTKYKITSPQKRQLENFQNFDHEFDKNFENFQKFDKPGDNWDSRARYSSGYQTNQTGLSLESHKDKPIVDEYGILLNEPEDNDLV